MGWFSDKWVRGGEGRGVRLKAGRRVGRLRRGSGERVLAGPWAGPRAPEKRRAGGIDLVPGDL